MNKHPMTEVVVQFNLNQIQFKFEKKHDSIRFITMPRQTIRLEATIIFVLVDPHQSPDCYRPASFEISFGTVTQFFIMLIH